ncbi:MAG: phosphoadenylyl-sulfate reductase, partial [Flavobacteriales bacterium]|nr:phosphoadenylyl-sulfate reductase [Flavobacteriales bacterium]
MKEQYENIRKDLDGLSTYDALTALSRKDLNISFSTSLGQEDQVITHMISALKLPIDIFTLDTGRLFPETYELLDKTRNKYQLPIEVFFPDSESIKNLVNTQGVNGFYDSVENRKTCCGVRKIEPLKAALNNVDVWITGLRASQSANRSQLSSVEWDESFNVIKFNPLINWSFDEVIDYLRSNNVPYNPLHDKGFVSIGCQPCTRAIEPGEDLRAGRW